MNALERAEWLADKMVGNEYVQEAKRLIVHQANRIAELERTRGLLVDSINNRDKMLNGLESENRSLKTALEAMHTAEQISVGERDGADALHEVEKQFHASTKSRVSDLESAGHQLAIELECLLLDSKDTVVVSRWMEPGMNAVSEWRELFEYQGPRLEHA